VHFSKNLHESLGAGSPVKPPFGGFAFVETGHHFSKNLQEM